MNRILVLGCSSSGKSTLTRALSARLGLPAVHLDMHFWQPGWIETPKEDWKKKISELTAEEKWIMDGTFAGSFDLRYPSADLIIVLNRSRLLCLWRAIVRVFKYRKNSSRPDMASGCHERFDFGFYEYIWTYHKKVTPLILKAAEKHGCREKMVLLNRNSDIERFMAKL